MTVHLSLVREPVRCPLVACAAMDSERDELRGALAFMAQVDEGVATEVRNWRLGTVLISPELPRVWDASYFRVEDPVHDDG